ncbi:MAG: phage portal protein, partial [Actinomycetota bacterium]
SGTALHNSAASFDHIYKSSAAVRTVIDWLARQVARYEPLVSVRNSGLIGPNDPGVELLRRPAPRLSWNELVREWTSSLALTGDSFTVLIRDDAGRVGSLVPIPRRIVSAAGIDPDEWVLNLPSGEKRIARADMLHIRLWNPGDGPFGTSPLESLRHLLAEDEAASRDRQRFWRNSARPYGWVERGLEAPEWSDVGRTRFKEDFKAAHSGENEFETLIIEDGMKWHDGSRITPADAAFIEGREQVLRAVAAAYGIPHQLVNTASENLGAAARLVEATLAPYVELIDGALNAQLDELWGSQAVNGRIRIELVQPGSLTDREVVSTLSEAVKAGWLAPDEARSVVDLPTIPGGDRLAPQPTPRAEQ